MFSTCILESYQPHQAAISCSVRSSDHWSCLFSMDNPTGFGYVVLFLQALVCSVCRWIFVENWYLLNGLDIDAWFLADKAVLCVLKTFLLSSNSPSLPPLCQSCFPFRSSRQNENETCLSSSGVGDMANVLNGWLYYWLH